MSNKTTLDASEISDGHMSRAWQAHTIRNAVKYDAYGAKTVFSVRVLTRPITLSGEEYAAIMGDATEATNAAPGTLKKDLSRFMFKGRITGAGGVPSPHLTLPDPCYLHDTASPDVTQCAARIISMHTTFFSDSNTQGALPGVGDVIRGQLEPGDLGKFNLQYATFTSMETIGNSARALSCRGALMSIFARAAGQASPAQINANNPNGRAIGDHGRYKWSDRKLQRIMKWESTKYTVIPNGTVLANGDKSLSPPGTYVSIGTGDLLAAAVPDWNKLKDAYAKRFPGKTLKSLSSYRSYQGQVAQRLLRHGADDKYKADQKPCTGQGGHDGRSTHKCTPAATPGTSNHGFGASVDIDKAGSGWTNTQYPQVAQTAQQRIDTASEQFKWINMYSINFNFKMTVSMENWHIDWVPLSDQLIAVQGKKPKLAANPWANMITAAEKKKVPLAKA